jgi:hypothetical protein
VLETGIARQGSDTGHRGWRTCGPVTVALRWWKLLAASLEPNMPYRASSHPLGVLVGEGLGENPGDDPLLAMSDEREISVLTLTEVTKTGE